MSDNTGQLTIGDTSYTVDTVDTSVYRIYTTTTQSKSLRFSIDWEAIKTLEDMKAVMAYLLRFLHFELGINQLEGMGDVGHFITVKSSEIKSKDLNAVEIARIRAKGIRIDHDS